MLLTFISLTLWAAVPAEAQGDSVFLDLEPANRLSSRLPNLSVRHLSYRSSGPECPQNVLALDFFYPQGFGRPKIDGAVAETITAKFEERRNGQFFCDPEFCGDVSCALWPIEKTFAVHAPSARFVSILFTENSYTGGAHGNLVFQVFNFDLENDRPMTLNDFFPRPEESVPRYWGQVYADWCRIKGVKFPLHLKSPEKCRPGETSQPPAEFQKVGDLEELGRLIFTPLGATLLLGPYEAGSYADGSQALDISKEKLLEMGANPILWAD